jgi:Predicted membrane protein (DUF2306)
MLRIRAVVWMLLTALAAVVALASLRYVLLRPQLTAGPIFADKFTKHLPWLLAHVVGGCVALLAGSWQFGADVRERWNNLQKAVGWTYAAAVAIGGVAGFRMALISYGGLPTHVGFGLLAVVWLFTTAMAVRATLSADLDSHGDWMIRSYALTFAAVTLRMWVPLLASRFPFLEAYTTAAWLCWVPNLLVAEWLVSRYRATAPLMEYTRESGTAKIIIKMSS